MTLLRRSEREFYDGFIERLLEELENRSGDEAWANAEAERLALNATDAVSGPTIDPVEWLETSEVRDRRRPRRLPGQAGDEVPEIPDFFLIPWEDPRKKKGLARFKRSKPMRGPVLPPLADALFERWVEEIEEVNTPRELPPPPGAAVRELPAFLLSPWSDPERKGRRAPDDNSSYRSLPDLPEYLLIPREDKWAPRALTHPDVSQSSQFIFRVEDKIEPRGLVATLRTAGRFIISLFDARVIRRDDDWVG